MGRALLQSRPGSGFYGDDWLATVNATLRYPDGKPSADDLAAPAEGDQLDRQEIWRHRFSQARQPDLGDGGNPETGTLTTEQFSTDGTYRALDTINVCWKPSVQGTAEVGPRAQWTDPAQRQEEESRPRRKDSGETHQGWRPLAGADTVAGGPLHPHSDVAAGWFQTDRGSPLICARRCVG